jgi:CBS domain-containing membrane protein
VSLFGNNKAEGFMPALTKVSEIMTKGVFAVKLDDTIRKADEIMRVEKVRHVPVLDGTKFFGLITERSLMEFTLKKLYDYEDEFGEDGYNLISDFQDIQTKDYHIIYPEDSVKKAVELMAKKKYECLPVVDWDNNLIGILTFTDILLFINKKLSEEI